MFFDILADSIRALRRAPAFSLLVIATLALGIGANTTMIAVLDELVLRPPREVADPGNLYSPSLAITRSDHVQYSNTVQSYPAFAAMRSATSAFSGVAAYTSTALSLGTGAEARAVSGMEVTGDYFGVFGTRPLQGRFFLPEDDATPSGRAVAVISHKFWQQQFAGAADAIGRTLSLNGNAYTVVGVVPDGFAGVRADRADIWLPLNAAQSRDGGGDGWRTNTNNIWLQVVARVRPGVSIEQAGSAATAAVRGSYSNGSDGATSALLTLQSILPTRAPHLDTDSRIALLLAAVSLLVLLTACANVANLTLARNSRRESELAVRLVLGVGYRRLAATLLAETLMLSVVGGAAALAMIGVVGTPLLRMLEQDRSATLFVDWRNVAVAFGVVLVAAIITGVGPAVSVVRQNYGTAMRSAGRTTTAASRVTRRALLMVQCASCVALLAGSALFALSLRQVAALQLGFDPNTTWIGKVGLQKAGYDSTRAMALQHDMVARALRIPGVTNASLASVTPLSGWGYALHITRPGHDSLARFPDGGPYYTAVGDDYFTTMGTHIVRGRAINGTDRAGGAPVAVISLATATKWFPGEDAVGQCLVVSPSTSCTTIVGIAEDVRRQQLVEHSSSSMIYVPIDQYPRQFASATVVVRARTGIDIAAALRRTMQGAAPGLPYAEIGSLRTAVDQYTTSWRLGSTVLTAFGLVALLLAAIGIYGVFSFVVVQRSREIGIRMALGARAAQVLRMMLRESVLISLAGAMGGLCALLIATPVVEPLLFRIPVAEPRVLLSTVAAVVAMALVACAVPAFRATQVEPMRVIRAD